MRALCVLLALMTALAAGRMLAQSSAPSPSGAQAKPQRAAPAGSPAGRPTAMDDAPRAPRGAPAAHSGAPSSPSGDSGKARPAAAPPAGSGRPAGTGAAGTAANSAAGAPPAATGAPPGAEMGNIDQILEGDEDVLAGSGFTYDPGNRRDPFKSLLIATERPEFRGPRPEGIPGLLIDEIDLKGIYRTARGYVAQVNAVNQKKSYLLKEGDQLYDGDVVSIGRNDVVFKQIVQDPTALKPFREVTKSLTAQ